jgi:23S rRNA (cytosine1962-C5)-methyltransferase
VPPLRFRAPGHALRLDALLARAVAAGDARALAASIRGGSVRVDGEVVREGDLLVPPGVRIEAALGAAGAQGRDERAEAAADAFLVLVPAPPWPSGRWEEEGGRESLAWRALEVRDGVAALAIEPWREGGAQLRRRLAVSGFPILGDVLHGGILVAGGLRLWSRAAAVDPADLLAWPEEPVFPSEVEDGRRVELRVSEATLRAVGRGHPWVLTDGETGDAGRFRPGTLVSLVSTPQGQGARAGREPSRAASRSAPTPSVLARIEGIGALAARVWEAGLHAGQRPRSVEARVADALARRRSLIAACAEGGTDCLRLVHGEADGLPGIAVDRLGPMLRVVVSGRACETVLERAIDTLVHAVAPALGAEPPVVRVLHLRERPPGRAECVSLVRGRLAADACDALGRTVVSERGLRYLADPGLASPERPSPAFGFFPDQRANRERVAALAKDGGRWLNLFAHTGAFSVALLAAGASSVTSVDLSAAYLRWLEENLALNGLAGPRHVSHRGDGRRFFERLDAGARFDGIVLDPPTAAAAGRRFWSVRRDLPALVEAALGRLAPGGHLLVTRNDRAARGRLAELVLGAASRAGAIVDAPSDAPPGPDFPSLRGFPEGDPFEGLLVRRALRPSGRPRASRR